MLLYINPKHALHAGRHEMFRGRLVPCHESPDHDTPNSHEKSS